MGCGLKEDRKMPNGGSECFRMSIIFLLLHISDFVDPVAGFALKTCRISRNQALCDKSYLTAVPLDIPRSVEGFSLTSNNISHIQVSDFKGLSLLTQLNLKHNNISQIDENAFADLISLKYLNLNYNKLVKLGDDLFHGLSNLIELRIDKNHIKMVTSTSFKSLANLKFLDISSNKLNHLANVHSIIQHLPQLQYLSIGNNNLTSFQSWELTNTSLALKNLDLSQNPLSVFRITADIFPNLTWFSIEGSGRKKMMKWDVSNKTFLSRVSTLAISGVQMASSDIKTLLGNVNMSLTSLRMNKMKHGLTTLINVSCTIPTMSTLQLQSNKFSVIHSSLFHLCINITELDLSANKIKIIQDNAFRSIPGLKILNLRQNKLPSVPPAVANLSALEQLDLSTNYISALGCQDFTNLTKLTQLKLYLNSISSLKECVFKDLKELQVLKLQTNCISELNGAFKKHKHMPNLRQLSLNNNSLTAIGNRDFESLVSLQNLSLHDNKIKTLGEGSFIGLTNLLEIQLQSNEIDKISRGCFSGLINLKRLDLRKNNIRYDGSSPLAEPPFSQLTRLEILAIPVQRHRGKAHLPCNLLQGLTNLLTFSTRNNQLLSLHKDMFIHTPKLQLLDMNSNDLKDLSPDLFSPIQGLKRLYISRTSLRSLDFLTHANLTQLEFMQARNNLYSVISEEVMRSLPGLAYVDFKGTGFFCDCVNAWFIQWAKKDNQTQVSDAYNFTCNYPEDLQNMKLLDFDVESCSVDIDFICFVSTTCTIIVFLVASFTYHFLRWQLAYAYHYFLAFLFEAKNYNKKAPYQYDAFISYNTHDEPWVINELLPKLEGEQGWRLCLHHRDFEPGKFIIDNITNAIYRSRKTICVISRRYLESEWCSREIQVASFRLFDEQKDVLILVFLEEIPAFQLSPYYRMRKLLKRRTYLSWPQTGEHTELFWEKLRQALKTREDFSEDRFLLNAGDRP